MHDTDETWDDIKRAAALLREASHAVALTGAGSSTPSGIPDFRTPGSGLWERADPMEVASVYAFRRNPQAFYDWMRSLVKTLLAAEPNAGHRALAELEEEGWLEAIITQNIDGLHQRAGSREVLEIHGHLREATCIRCYKVLHIGDLLEDFLNSGEAPRCPACGGVMKPNVVLFGEQLPIKVVNAAMAHIRQADLMLVAGSSLEVMPALRLPALVHEHGGRLIVVNLMPTYIDAVADVVIRGDVVEVLPLVARICIEGTSRG
ncbi:MAG: RNA polymerase subunit sigma [Chloroflexi bacterium]|nr:MAG: RNA polymerase subunit sigma [Chloroflexota bacterium]